MAQSSTNITWSEATVSRAQREAVFKQKGATIWLTGLSASGKSTIGAALEAHLLSHSIHSYRLDGDNIRFGLNKNLGFSPEDRAENIRRIGEVAKLFADAAVISITSFISPYKEDRNAARKLHAGSDIPFIEVFIDVPLEVAEQRDPKGLYKKARAGVIKDFTGIDAPYEAPDAPELHLKTHELGVQEAVLKIVDYLRSKSII